MSRPILEEFLGEELDLLEEVLQFERDRGARSDRRDSSDGIVARGADHHFSKADGHIFQSGPNYQGMDGTTGKPHLALAILRLLFALKCAFSATPNTERNPNS